MSPTQQQTPQDNNAVRQPEPVQLRTLQNEQPAGFMPMNSQKPHPETNQTVGLRGGDRGGLCPGRFCFCIPCPLPCDCCCVTI